jgi:small subunit ribosomal protein S8
MSMQDPIADMFIRLKNAQAVAKEQIVLPASKLKVAIAKLLKDEGYIKDYYLIEGECNKNNLVVVLNYFQGKSVIAMLKRVSRPGIRIYKSCDRLPKVLGGLGVAIISTSKGLLTDRAARALKQGGEVIGMVA